MRSGTISVIYVTLKLDRADDSKRSQDELASISRQLTFITFSDDADACKTISLNVLISGNIYYPYECICNDFKEKIEDKFKRHNA